MCNGHLNIQILKNEAKKEAKFFIPPDSMLILWKQKRTLIELERKYH